MKKNQCRDVIQAVLDQQIDVERAARILNKSIRQIYRLLSKARKQGASNIVHGNTGRSPSNKICEEVWCRVIALARTKYHNANDYQLHKLLEEEHDLKVSRESLRKKLRAAGIAPREKNAAHHQENLGHGSKFKPVGNRENNDPTSLEN